MATIDIKWERNKQLATLVLMVLSYLPLLLLIDLPDFGSLRSAVTYFAAMSGYLAAILMIWQFVLGTRSVSSLIHKDQVWALGVHKKIGIYGIALVIMHPLLIAYSYSENLDYIFGLSFDGEFQKHVTFGRIAFMLFLFVWFSSAILRANIGYRPWKYIHYLTYIILPLLLLHTPVVGSQYGSNGILRTYWTALIVIFVLMLVMRLKQLFTFGQAPYELVAKKEVAESIFLYRLKPHGKQLAPAAGQFVVVRRGFWSEEHPFSVASFNSKTGEITIAVKVFGKYTKKLSELAIGEQLFLDGPYGVFTQEIELNPKKPVTLVAGGIGVTPFIQHITTSKRRDITLFNANRSQQFAIFDSLFKKLLKERYVPVLSSPTKKSSAKTGYVTAELIKQHHGKAFTNQDFYICGPPIMMTKLKEDLEKAGIKPGAIHTEEFGF